ncbi:hypothetical protein FC26_GL001274 [Paucilactobacillus vaccinostercus DSM 20634]|uniref:HTH marR-type domain-containing protein n=1 Tax=Paucilactobacillus vaccinostercus DSM 20634 TaxID=1423813 RepID=A0A0R2A3R7_9LACO|nr:MarR family winged helix-turn-helix transcriptional regulator [Paucilactobacillus vaccinostercus]KRM61832.1 hypothetical protein FC26_GL001274 [Paucilactobacillus vaccinostercus DSM 20634]
MGVKEKDVGQYVNKLHNKIRRELDISATRNGINGAQARTLIYILVETQTHDIFQKDVEEKYSIRPSTASALLKKMEQAGLIVRQSMPEDNRRKRIIPTAKAEQARSGVLADIIQLENKLTAHVDDADLAVFFKVMAQMLENMH